ncbi:hydrogenase maturation protease [Kitasatospora sp. MAP5-34]|uniref:hydrogenase maturation protease n=1 Tax=Kitasatospora sp. MAP5-34 TaxID=3035102 RepID=UPI0024769C60|nr:hydrogenase maturation protease [Kitasatospora sp. MAP5-34]MDH6574705.1 hydrogenase maturation protease [Kitasatospora sp. MAP5-34]
MPRTRIVLISIGTEDRHDDGAGLAVVAELRRNGIDADLLALCDGESTRLPELWEGADLAVVVDTMHSHPGQAGRVHRVRVRSAGSGTVRAEGSAADSHSSGLGHAVSLATVIDRLPGELLIITVEGEDFTVGQGLSPAVAAAVPQTVSMVRKAVAAHRLAAPLDVGDPIS